MPYDLEKRERESMKECLGSDPNTNTSPIVLNYTHNKTLHLESQERNLEEGEEW